MSRLVSAGLLVCVWLGVGLSAQQPGQSWLRASLEREATRLASTLASEALPSTGSTAFKTSAAQPERPDDWGAVRRLKEGTRVRVTTRRGRARTGRLTAVSEDAIQMDNARAVLRDDVSEVRLPHRLGVAAYGGLGLALGGLTGVFIGTASCARGCSELGSALAVPAGLFYGALWGGMGGLVAGEMVHHRPERLVYVRRTL